MERHHPLAWREAKKKTNTFYCSARPALHLRHAQDLQAGEVDKYLRRNPDHLQKLASRSAGCDPLVGRELEVPGNDRGPSGWAGTR